MEALAWLVAALVLLGVEAATLAFVAVYFGAGALGAALAAALGAPIWLQAIVFAAISLATLAGTRGLLRTAMRRTPLVRGNAQSVVGQRGVVTRTIGRDTGRGQVRIGTEYWSARPYIDDVGEIEAGTPVEVLGLEGVTALVIPLDRALTA